MANERLAYLERLTQQLRYEARANEEKARQLRALLKDIVLENPYRRSASFPRRPPECLWCGNLDTEPHASICAWVAARQVLA